MNRSVLAVIQALQQFRCLVVKDLLAELRLRRVWPCMLLLGLLLVLLIEMQIDLPDVAKYQVLSGFFWLIVFFAGTFALERSFASEREEGCWRTLQLYPLPPSVLFLAKVTVNVLALALLECCLIPAFVVFSNIPLLAHPFCLVGIASLANLGCAVVGVLVSALTASVPHKGNLLALLLFPLITPLLVGAAALTQQMLLEEFTEEWWRWLQVLGLFVVLFFTVGILVFEFILED